MAERAMREDSEAADVESAGAALDGAEIGNGPGLDGGSGEDAALGPVRAILGSNPCLVVAHPDDETLWCGGLVWATRDLGWTIVCCSIPVADPVRAWLWNDACQALGAKWAKLLPTPENPGGLLTQLPGLRGYSCYVTHGAAGEYGHIHHQQVHQHVIEDADADVLTINTQAGEYRIDLGPETLEAKMAALQRYRHILPYMGEDLPKWEALIKRYGDDFDIAAEGYDLWTHK